MARLLPQTLSKLSLSSLRPSLSFSPRLLTHRAFSNKAELIEVDLVDGGGDGGEVEVMGLRRLEDAIHHLIVKRLEPTWLPFRPGSSYWVPPKKRADNILEVVGKLTNPLSLEEALSLSSPRGFPSSSYFLEGSPVAVQPMPVAIEVQVHVRSSPEKETTSDDED